MKEIRGKYLLAPEKYIKFFEAALFITDFETNNVIPFKVNPIQKRLIYECVCNNRILKARRHGLSTVILAIAFLNCLEMKNFKAVFVADKKDNALAIFEKIHFFLDHLPFKVETSSKTKGELGFLATGSKIVVLTAGAKTSGRGRDTHFIHFSEAAFFETVEMITAVRESRLPEAITFYETTANGMNHFYNAWELSQKYPIESKTKPFFFSWAEHPSYRKPVSEDFSLRAEEKILMEETSEKGVHLTNENIMWMRWKLADMDDPALFPQEYPLFPRDAFISTGRPVFNLNQLDRMKNFSRDYRMGNLELNRKHETQFIDEKGGYIRFFIAPEPGKQYIIGADVAEGKQDGDFSAAVVFDAQTREQVAEFHGLLDPDQFAYRLNQLGRFYNNALLAVERMGPGHSVNSMLFNHYDYPRLLMETTEDAEMAQESSANVGFRTTKATRDRLIALGKRAIRLGLIKLNSVPCIMECCSFVTNKVGKAEHSPGKHDDRVLAMLIAILCMEDMPELAHKYFREVSGSKYYKFIEKAPKIQARRISGYGA